MLDRARKVPSRSGNQQTGKIATARRGRADRRRPAEQSSKDLALAIADIGLDKKALNVEIIDVGDKSDYADYVVVMSGRSDRQVRAIADHLLREMSQEHGARCMGVEGLPHGFWVLMDYGDIIVHVFYEETRNFYDLEGLWLDAKRITSKRLVDYAQNTEPFDGEEIVID